MIAARVRSIAAALALATTVAAPAAARAGCDLPVDRLITVRGSVAAGARCGSMVVATDAAATSSSQARVVIPTTIPYRLAFTARRLSGDGAAAIEVELQGGYFLWRDGGWSIYFDEAQFARDGWHAVPGLDTRRDRRVAIERTAGAVTVSLDGVQLGRWPLAEISSNGPSLVLIGRRGARSRLLIRDLSLTPIAR